MKDSQLIKQSVTFSVYIVKYYKWLVYDKKEYDTLKIKCTSLKKMLISTLNTLKKDNS